MRSVNGARQTPGRDPGELQRRPFEEGPTSSGTRQDLRARAARESEASDGEHAPDPAEACSEAAARLNVVIRMLHADYCEKLRPAEAQEHSEYGVRQVADGLRDIRNLLKAAIRDGEHRRAS